METLPTRKTVYFINSARNLKGNNNFLKMKEDDINQHIDSPAVSCDSLLLENTNNAVNSDGSLECVNNNRKESRLSA